eukprot:GILK01005399.1.p1 GENE.GILK01005399.1~~GILK01005399.1.p1  ORF type:complete len:278 (+),score=53.84 GILK01005399.1:38-835(+)
MAATDSFCSLVESFSTRVKELKGLMLLRTADIRETWTVQMENINSTLEEAESQMNLLKRQLESEKQYIQKAEELIDSAQRQSRDVRNVASIVNIRQAPSSTSDLSAPASQVPSGLVDVTNQFKNVVAAQSSAPTKKPSAVPQISLLTVEELAAVPQYQKGRVSVEKVNACIEELQSIVKAKYRILATPINKQNDEMIKKFKVYKAQETEELKSSFFFCETDFRSAGQLRLDATGKCVLNILRHTGRMSVNSTAGLMRYVLNPSQP